MNKHMLSALATRRRDSPWACRRSAEDLPETKLNVVGAWGMVSMYTDFTHALLHRDPAGRVQWQGDRRDQAVQRARPGRL